MNLQSPGVVPAVVTASATPSFLTNVHVTPSSMRFLSAAHLFFAFVIVTVQIVATSIAETNSDSNSVDRIYSSSSTGAGIWCGVFFAGTGVLGLMTARKKSNCYLISYLTLSVLCVVPFCTLECAAASHDLAERFYLFCNHRFSSATLHDGPHVVPCSRYYGAMVCLNVSLLVATLLEACVAVASVVHASWALHRGRGCVCCCACCYGADDVTASSSLTPPPQSFVIYTRGNVMPADHRSPPITANTGPVSAPHAVLAFSSSDGAHPQYFSFHAADSSMDASLVDASLVDLTGARYTADEIAPGIASSTPALDVSLDGAGLIVDNNGRVLGSRSPPPSYEESIKR